MTDVKPELDLVAIEELEEPIRSPYMRRWVNTVNALLDWVVEVERERDGCNTHRDRRSALASLQLTPVSIDPPPLALKWEERLEKGLMAPGDWQKMMHGKVVDPDPADDMRTIRVKVTTGGGDDPDTP